MHMRHIVYQNFSLFQDYVISENIWRFIKIIKNIFVNKNTSHMCLAFTSNYWKPALFACNVKKKHLSILYSSLNS